MSPRNHPLRSHIVALLRRGELASAGEAVIVAGVTRRTVYRWMAVERIDIGRARLRWLARHRGRAMRIMEGQSPRSPSRSELRRLADKAVRDFNRANGNRSRNCDL